MALGPDKTALAEQLSAAPPAPRWHHKLLGLLFAVICFEVGLFLVAFPWMVQWSSNSLSTLSPWWREVWFNPYFRGAVSGLGVVNLYIALLEMLRLRRFAFSLK